MGGEPPERVNRHAPNDTCARCKGGYVTQEWSRNPSGHVAQRWSCEDAHVTGHVDTAVIAMWWARAIVSAGVRVVCVPVLCCDCECWLLVLAAALLSGFLSPLLRAASPVPAGVRCPLLPSAVL